MNSAQRMPSKPKRRKWRQVLSWSSIDASSHDYWLKRQRPIWPPINGLWQVTPVSNHFWALESILNFFHFFWPFTCLRILTLVFDPLSYSFKLSPCMRSQPFWTSVDHVRLPTPVLECYHAFLMNAAHYQAQPLPSSNTHFQMSPRIFDCQRAFPPLPIWKPIVYKTLPRNKTLLSCLFYFSYLILLLSLAMPCIAQSAIWMPKLSLSILDITCTDLALLTHKPT